MRLLSLTPEGRRVRDTVRAVVQNGEEDLLGRIPAADREAFLRSLHTLYEMSRGRPDR